MQFHSFLSACISGSPDRPRPAEGRSLRLVSALSTVPSVASVAPFLESDTSAHLRSLHVRRPRLPYSMRISPWILLAVAVVVGGLPLAAQQSTFDLVISGGRVIDPETGL